MLLKTQETCPNQSAQDRQLSKMPASDYGFVGAFGTAFPVASDLRSRRPRVAGDQVSWSNCAGEIGALGKVIALVATCKNAGVSSRCGCGPAGDLAAVLEIKSESPLGVDANDFFHRYLVRSNDISNYNLVRANLDTRKPEEHKRDENHESDRGQRPDQPLYAIGCENASKGKQHRYGDDNGKYLGGFGMEDLHHTSFALNREVCA